MIYEVHCRVSHPRIQLYPFQSILCTNHDHFYIWISLRISGVLLPIRIPSIRKYSPASAILILSSSGKVLEYSLIQFDNSVISPVNSFNLICMHIPFRLFAIQQLDNFLFSTEHASICSVATADAFSIETILMPVNGAAF